MASRWIVLAGVMGVLALAGCAHNSACCDDKGSDKAAPKAAQAAGAPVAVINTMCPIGSDDFAEHTRPPELARAHKGESIGFCCESCVKKFDKMTDAQKDGVLAAAKANKAL